MAVKNRPLCILEYIWKNTDEEHFAIITEIIAYLETRGIVANRKTVASDIAALQKMGFDIICYRSRQNRYFMGNRILEIAELKIIIDAIQAARFISKSKSIKLIEKVSSLAGAHQAELLKRSLYVEEKNKTTNESVNYTVDFIHAAIQNENTIEFQYLEYTPRKEKVLKHRGYSYRFSPYDLVWNNDSYYVFGWSEKHRQIVKFRVDRMYRPAISNTPYHSKPDDYSIKEYCEQVFMMYDGKHYRAKLLCENELMKTIVDKFGDGVDTSIHNDKYFIATVDIFASPTFFSWIFNYCGKIQIIEPESLKEEYKERLDQAYKKA